ncbi:hypothetical protein NQ314_019609 [Rhamnusium bicolor]|uniref:C2H2-type domain-containing protein n=1 Tax=Rhamnusium bicolor TaxID=1586634 RepID=A0AAV8WM65_9CUCU|nr:hypothetical protein NQ314_019609 [Rhamnusium bicolor]
MDGCLFTDTSPFKCFRCGRGYSVQYTLERHLRYECGVAKQFSCEVCLRKFSRRDILRNHEKKFSHHSSHSTV